MISSSCVKLHSGHSLLDIGFPSPGAAPLYAVWYFLLSKLQSDRVELYYLNYRVLTILVPIALYLLFRRTKLGIAPSFSRPRVSNDNPYSESFFKTLKYRPEFHNRFAGYDDAH